MHDTINDESEGMVCVIVCMDVCQKFTVKEKAKWLVLSVCGNYVDVES